MRTSWELYRDIGTVTGMVPKNDGSTQSLWRYVCNGLLQHTPKDTQEIKRMDDITMILVGYEPKGQTQEGMVKGKEVFDGNINGFTN